MAKQIIKDIKKFGGFITRKDLRKYRAKARKPLKTTLKRWEMLSIPAPGSGALVSLALKILAGKNLTIFFSLFGSVRTKKHPKWPLIYM